MARRTISLLLALLALLVVAPAAAQADAGGAPGAVNFVRPAESSFDRFTQDSRHSQFMNSKYWRVRAYDPYFDSRLAWYDDAWLYINAYAIYQNHEIARNHPEWILRDAQGNRLYIPYGCWNGTCPQYAGDITNPAFRENWMRIAQERIDKGYKGLFIDDVNMWLNVGNGNGDDVAPIDRRTGKPMTDAAWREALASFLEEIRARFPQVEIVHNSVWFAQGGPAVDRQIKAADVIEIERGVNDAGLTGGDGTWSVSRLMSFIDRVHGFGGNVILDGDARTNPDREYGLAAYYLVSNGGDGLGNDLGGRPDDWWAGYDTDLGAPRGARYLWKGLIRRDFEHGSVLVNEPGEPAKTVPVEAGTRRAGSTGTISSVTIGAAQGAVLVGPTGAAAVPQPPQQPVDPPAAPPVAEPQPEPVADVPSPQAPAPAPQTAPAPVVDAPFERPATKPTTRPAVKKKPVKKSTKRRSLTRKTKKAVKRRSLARKRSAGKAEAPKRNFLSEKRSRRSAI